MKDFQRFIIWAFILTLTIMLVMEQDWAREIWQNTVSWMSPSPEETLAKEVRMLEVEVVRKQALERRKPKITAYTLLPGQIIEEDVRDKKWVIDCDTDGWFWYHLVYQGQVVKTNRFEVRNGRKTWDRINPDTFPVDKVVFEQDRNYPYGPITVWLTLTEKPQQ